MKSEQEKQATQKANINGQQIQVVMNPDIAQGVYSNVANIGHSPEEFSLDFLYLHPGQPPFGKLVTRVILTPGHAKRLSQALNDNIRKFEEKFGKIQNPGPVPTAEPQGPVN